MADRAWLPALTSQFPVCPVPFHLDTWRGCPMGCRYCFARDLVGFHRRNREDEREKTFAWTEPNDPEYFARWMEKVHALEVLDYSRGAEVMVRDRMALKVGANSDPCPPREAKDRVTYRFLQVLHGYDYPVEVQTKNPAVLAGYAGEFRGANWTVAVSLTSTDERYVRDTEPGAPSPAKRLRAVEELVGMGFPVMVKCQPAVWPRAVTDVPPLVRACRDAGCWAFQTEGLKMRATMPAEERETFDLIGRSIGEPDMARFFRRVGVLRGGDREYRDRYRLEYSRAAWDECRSAGLRYFSADNYLGAVGDGLECCGTERLRGYSVWGGSDRSRYWRAAGRVSEEVLKVVVNFTRSRAGQEPRTVAEVYGTKPAERASFLGAGGLESGMARRAGG